MADLSKFFPDLKSTVPSGASSDTLIHDFSSSALMLLDENSCLDVLKVSDISKYPSTKSSRPTGATFVITNDLIAYAVKAGTARLIHRASAERTLLKGHTDPIVDMCFAGSNLATCADDELCIVWEVMKQTADNTELEARETLRLRVPVGDGIQRVIFHPNNERLLFIAHGPTVSGVLLNKTSWEIFTSLENPELGAPLEQVAVYRLINGHNQNINDISFDNSGSQIITAGDDGFFSIWSLDAITPTQTEKDLKPLWRKNMNQPIMFARFIGDSIACGFTNIEEMQIVSGPPNYEVLSKVRFAISKAGSPTRFRAQSIGKYIVLCDTSSPIVVLVHMDETGFQRAVCLKVATPILNFSLASSGPDSIQINGVGEGLIQTFEIPSLSKCLPIIATRPAKTVPTPRSMISPGETKQVPQNETKTISTPQTKTPSHEQVSLPEKRSNNNTNGGDQSTSLNQVNQLIQEKMDQLLTRLEASAKAKEDLEKERQKRLLESLSSVIANTIPDLIESAISAKLDSPQFISSLTTAVKASVDAGVSREVKTVVEKSLRTLLPPMLEKIGDSVSAQVTAKLQQPLGKAFEEGFQKSLVPAFEAGCQEMMNQFQDNFSKRLNVESSSTVTKNSAPSYLDQIESAMEKKNYPLALQAAILSNNAELLTDTCARLDLVKLLLSPSHGIPQITLVGLLKGLSINIASSPLSRLEWIESVALAIDPSAEEIQKILSRNAKETRDALIKESELFASLGPAATRFRAVLHILVSLSSKS